MKKKLFILLLCMCIIFVTACGKSDTTANNTENVQDVSQVEENSRTGIWKKVKIMMMTCQNSKPDSTNLIKLYQQT